MDLIFETIECTDIEKRCLAVFQLTFSATDWWDTVKAMIGEDAKTQFLEKYFPESKKNKREIAFIQLIQGNLTVPEYTTQFERLSQFAPHMISTPRSKIKRYHKD